MRVTLTQRGYTGYTCPLVVLVCQRSYLAFGRVTQLQLRVDGHIIGQRAYVKIRTGPIPVERSDGQVVQYSGHISMGTRSPVTINPRVVRLSSVRVDCDSYP